jgi:serine protease Do
MRSLFFAVLVSLPFLAWGGSPQAPGSDDLWTELAPPVASGSPGASLASLSGLIEKSRAGVVAVQTEGPAAVLDRSPTPFGLERWRLFPDVDSERVEGIGSGFVVRADGLVVTNQHVIEGAERIWVRLPAIGQRLRARVIGSDPRSDLALLKVTSRKPLHVLPLGDSDRLRPGAWVVAIGNPFGLECVATKGIVSGKGRTLGELPRFKAGFFDFIQTDAAIDRGNSGGPLLNLRGEVVGVNTAINARARGIGFAIPVNLVKAVLPHLMRHGRLVRSYLGVTIDDLSWELASSFGLDRARGVVIIGLRSGSPAEAAGLQKGDVILELDGFPIASRADLAWRASTWPAGRSLQLTVFRRGREQAFSLTPVVRPSEREKSAQGAKADRGRVGDPAPSLPLAEGSGLRVVELAAEVAEKVRLPAGTKGVVVIACDGPAAEGGLRLGDVICEIDGRPVGSPADLVRSLADLPIGGMVRFYLYRQRNARFVAFEKNWKNR